MRSLVIEASNKESNAVRSPVVALSSELHVAAQVGNHFGQPECRVVPVPRGQTLRPHPAAQALGIGGQTGERNADVSVL